MKKLITLLLVICSFSAMAQIDTAATVRTPPSGFAPKIVTDRFLRASSMLAIPFVNSTTPSMNGTVNRKGYGFQILSNNRFAIGLGSSTFEQYMGVTELGTTYVPKALPVFTGLASALADLNLSNTSGTAGTGAILRFTSGGSTTPEAIITHQINSSNSANLIFRARTVSTAGDAGVTEMFGLYGGASNYALFSTNVRHNGTGFMYANGTGANTTFRSFAQTLSDIGAEPTITNLPVTKGGTGIISYTAGNYLNAATTTTLQQRTPAQVLSDIAAAPLASPTFTGTPTLPTGTIAVTQAAIDNSTKVATTGFVQAANALKADLTTNTFSGLQQFGLGAQFNSATSARFYNAANTFFTNVLPTTITANRAITLPDASGVIALTSNLSSYAPYTGATSNLDIGVYNFTAGGVTINGALQIKDNWGMYLFNPSSVYSVQIQAPTLTANRNVYFPDATGTVSLTSDLPISASFSGVGTATTTFTVTIGTTQANNTYRVNVTPTNVLSAAVFYVTNKTTTTFDVVYLSGLTGTIAFDWSLFKI